MCEFGEQPRLRSRMSVAEDLIVSCKGDYKLVLTKYNIL
ncbi:hypothetical protein Leryth_013729, partial [Lithospermum erythrorhizon]